MKDHQCYGFSFWSCYGIGVKNLRRNTSLAEEEASQTPQIMCGNIRECGGGGRLYSWVCPGSYTRGAYGLPICT